MPANLHALIRYRTIDHCLRRKGKLWTWKDLARECGNALRYYISAALPDPSRRTVMYDLDTMKNGKLGYEAPIVFDRTRQSYGYSDPAFSISNSPINSEDVEELNHALLILKQFSGFKHMEGIENIITKLEHTIQLKGGLAKVAIQFDHPMDAPGQKWLDLLYRSIQQEIVIDLEYQPFHFTEPFRVLISPYLLKEYNKRWFVLGHNHELELISTFALDRIRAIQATTARFYHHPDFDTNRYFRDIIGVSVPENGQVEEVLLEATPRRSKYIQTKPLHHSQRLLQEAPGRSVFAFSLIPNYELESLILSFGEEVRVLAPERLAERIAQRAQSLMAQYLS